MKYLFFWFRQEDNKVILKRIPLEECDDLMKKEIENQKGFQKWI